MEEVVVDLVLTKMDLLEGGCLEELEGPVVSFVSLYAVTKPLSRLQLAISTE